VLELRFGLTGGGERLYREIDPQASRETNRLRVARALERLRERSALRILTTGSHIVPVSAGGSSYPPKAASRLGGAVFPPPGWPLHAGERSTPVSSDEPVWAGLPVVYPVWVVGSVRPRAYLRMVGVAKGSPGVSNGMVLTDDDRVRRFVSEFGDALQACGATPIHCEGPAALRAHLDRMTKADLTHVAFDPEYPRGKPIPLRAVLDALDE
jgi:hypothetical protein